MTKQQEYINLANRFYDAFTSEVLTSNLVKEVLVAMKDAYFMQCVALEFPYSDRYRLLNFTGLFVYFSDDSKEKVEQISQGLYETLRWMCMQKHTTTTYNEIIGLIPGVD